MSDYGYVFVLSSVDIKADLPYEIIPDHYLRKAKKEEISIIKQLIQQVRSVNISTFQYERTGQESKSGDKEGERTIHTEALPEPKWAYWVISFKGYNDKVENLRYASSLAKNGIELGFLVYHHENLGGPMLQFGGHSEFSYFAQYNFGAAPSFTLTSEDLQEIRNTYTRITELSKDYFYIHRAIKWFNELNKLPRTSDYHIIGLFTIIESLISHNPSDTSSSINHQISTKMPLLNRHFSWDLDYQQYFESASELKYWKKMYAYRCKLVHEGNTELKGDLQVLRNRENVIAFLTRSVKKLLKSSLIESEFLVDLKKC